MPYMIHLLKCKNFWLHIKLQTIFPLSGESRKIISCLLASMKKHPKLTFAAVNVGS